jgi:protein-S-isoprenylcysteine O-methyltransferase Ste14
MIKEFFKKYETLVNIVLFLSFAGLGMQMLYQKVVLTKTFNSVELGFIIESMALAIVILCRKPFRFVDTNLFDQTIALIAFFSGAVLFRDQPITGGLLTFRISQFIVLCANVLGLIILVNLGRSFGILIALRELKSTGLYAFVRHPMYATDILLRIGFVISHCNRLSVIVVLISTACYGYRAILEERFLSQQPEYRDYMHKVKYRFIPAIF